MTLASLDIEDLSTQDGISSRAIHGQRDFGLDIVNGFPRKEAGGSQDIDNSMEIAGGRFSL